MNMNAPASFFVFLFFAFMSFYLNQFVLNAPDNKSDFRKDGATSCNHYSICTNLNAFHVLL